MDVIIKSKFDIWDKSIENKEFTEFKNAKLIGYFEKFLKTNPNKVVITGKFHNEEIISDNKLNKYPIEQNLQTKKHEAVNYDLKNLFYGAYNKIETYLINNELFSKVFFDHINGGRVGLVHGGYLFFVLILNTHILIKEILNLSLPEYHFIKIKTSYKKKVPVNNFVIVKAKFLNKEKNEIIAEIIDSDLDICTTISCSIKIIKEISNF